MQNANCNNISVNPHATLDKNTETPCKKIPQRQAVGSMMHLALVSRPDIMYGVSLVGRYLDCYDYTHWNDIKNILKNQKATKDYGVCLLFKIQLNTVEAYCDADYANDTST